MSLLLAGGFFLLALIGLPALIREKRWRELGVFAVLWLLAAALAFLLMRFGGEALLSLFLGHNSEVVGALALRAMELFSLTYLTCWFNVAISAFFTAVNRPGASLILSFGNALVFPLLALAVLPRLWGIDGVWLTPACGDLLTAVAAVVLLLYFWRRKERKTALEEV